MNCVVYHVVGTIVCDMLTVIIVVIMAMNVVDLAVFDENPGGFAEHLCEDFSHFGPGSWLSTNTFFFILRAAVHASRPYTRIGINKSGLV